MATNSSSTLIGVESTSTFISSSSTFTSTFTSSVLSSVPVTTSSIITSTSVLSTSTVTASSAPPSSTQLITSTARSTLPGPTTVTFTRTSTSTTASSSSATASSSTTPSLTDNGSSNGQSSGLSPAGTIAIAVVVPVVVVALLVIFAIFFWRRRKQRKIAEEQRRKEVEDYGYNPNNDPTIPAVAAMGAEMSEDQSGYRGWGAATASNRKASTTLSGGHTQQLSDGGSALYANSGSPHNSDGNSQAGLMDRRQTMGSDEFTATPLAAGAAAGGAAAVAPGAMRRGPSNASSRYSGGAVSEHSDEPAVPQIPQSYESHGYGYAQHGPYGDGSYGGGQQGMPIVRDVSARRNTRIQQAGNYQQGNSGISQNF